MTTQVQRPRTREPDSGSSWDPDATRLLALLEANPDDAMTVADIRERGIAAPAQMIYALQLAGYDIDRAPIHGNSRGPLGYRLRSGTPLIDGHRATPHEPLPLRADRA